MANTLLSGIVAPSAIVTLSGTQTLTNKTISNLIATGTLTVNGTTGTNGQYLKTTGSGLTWANAPSPALSSLTDVVISSPAINQVLTYTGSAWINQDSNAQVASAIFGSTLYDMGFVYDSATISEDEGDLTTTASYIYDLGVLSFTGIISLSNLDQSVKSDYVGYSIIFGF